MLQFLLCVFGEQLVVELPGADLVLAFLLQLLLLIRVAHSDFLRWQSLEEQLGDSLLGKEALPVLVQERFLLG